LDVLAISKKVAYVSVPYDVCFSMRMPCYVEQLRINKIFYVYLQKLTKEA